MLHKGGKILKNSRKSSISPMMRKRMIVIFGSIFFIMLLLIVRVGWIQVVQGRELKKLAVEQWNSEVKVDAKRGEILDRNGEKLALSASCRRVDVYMPDVIKVQEDNEKIKNEIASKIAGILGQEQEGILKKLNATQPNGQPVKSVTLERRIDNDKGDAIKKLKLPGIIVSEDSKRFYVNENFLSHVLGFTNIDGQGQQGIEFEYDKELKGIPGTINMETDIYGRELPYEISKINAPVNGDDITLTIDQSIQLYVEKALEDTVVKSKAKSATAIVMDPKTGEILAMSSKPDFNPNDPKNMSGYATVQDMMQSWNNKAVTFTYEPGSVFKLVTATAALSENIVNDSTRFNCQGYLTVAGRKLYDWKRTGDGIEDFAEIIQNSCNVGFMTLGAELGKEKLYKYIDAFGFGKKTGIDVNYEETGYEVPIDKVGPVELANISFGQGIVVTPIQLISAYASIANGGKMMVPRLVKSIDSRDQDGNITESKKIQPKLLRQVVDANTANELLGYLETVITVGGGHSAYVEGYRIAGKTGTAQKAENGKYIQGKYVSTFVGMAPVDNPQFVVIVLVDEPDPSNYYASQVASPAAAQIFKDIFTIRNIPQDKSSESSMRVVPNMIGLSEKDAQNRLKYIDFTVEVHGSGTTVESTNPMPGVSLEPDSKVTLNMGNGGNLNRKVFVPDIINMDKEHAQALLDSLGLKLDISGKGFISNQNPKAGNTVDKGAAITAQMEEVGD